MSRYGVRCCLLVIGIHDAVTRRVGGSIIHRCNKIRWPVTVMPPIYFYSARNARIASAVLATAIPSVSLSVRHTPVLCRNDAT